MQCEDVTFIDHMCNNAETEAAIQTISYRGSRESNRDTQAVHFKKILHITQILMFFNCVYQMSFGPIIIE